MPKLEFCAGIGRPKGLGERNDLVNGVEQLFLAKLFLGVGEDTHYEAIVNALLGIKGGVKVGTQHFL
jgi:hypothetical protein